MPRIMVEMLEGRTMEQKKKIACDISAAVEEIYNIPKGGAAVRIAEVKFEDFACGGELRCDTSAREGNPVYGRGLEPRITLNAIAGRSAESREKLASVITDKVSATLGVNKDDVKIFFMHQPKENFAVGGILVCDQ